MSTPTFAQIEATIAQVNAAWAEHQDDPHGIADQVCNEIELKMWALYGAPGAGSGLRILGTSMEDLQRQGAAAIDALAKAAAYFMKGYAAGQRNAIQRCREAVENLKPIKAWESDGEKFTDIWFDIDNKTKDAALAAIDKVAEEVAK